jgi:glycine cleavage system H protein
MKSIPEEIKYTRLHIWIDMDDEFTGRCGISERRIATLDFITFIDFPEVNLEVRQGEKVAFVESDKAFFDVFSPVSGRITEINRDLEFTPGLINQDPLGEGWIYKIDVKEPNEFYELMNFDEYSDYLVMEGDI